MREVQPAQAECPPPNVRPPAFVLRPAFFEHGMMEDLQAIEQFMAYGGGFEHEVFSPGPSTVKVAPGRQVTVK
ncbi:MAG: hypothetical protein AMXMBFR7_12870 [Planctomycetota bacterium]